MVTSAFPISILGTNCVSAFDADPPQTQLLRRQPDLVIRAQAGDPQAFTEIYLMHKNMQSYTLRRLCQLSLLALPMMLRPS